MQFIRAEDPATGVGALAERLCRDLASGPVLWLVSGGSNLEASVQVMRQIPAPISQNLQVMPVDERYGAPGHDDSNWAQLLAAGFDGKRARLTPVLRAGDSLEAAAAHFETIFDAALAAGPAVIAQLGIGADGHIAGILPGSPAAREDKARVSAYEAPPYRRLTLTFPALRRISADYSLVFGAAKRPALEALARASDAPLDRPAAILREIPEAYVYNDQLEAIS